MITKQQFVEYLICTIGDYTCSHLAVHLENVSHDVIIDCSIQSDIHGGGYVHVMPIEQVEVVSSQLGNNAGVIGEACWTATIRKPVMVGYL